MPCSPARGGFLSSPTRRDGLVCREDQLFGDAGLGSLEKTKKIEISLSIASEGEIEGVQKLLSTKLQAKGYDISDFQKPELQVKSSHGEIQKDSPATENFPLSLRFIFTPKAFKRSLTASRQSKQAEPAADAEHVGRMRVSPSYVEWLLPRAALETKNHYEERKLEDAPPLVSRTFEVMQEPCVLKFWPRGRKGFTGTGVYEQSRQLCSGERWTGNDSWMTLAIFPTRHGANLRLRLLVGPKEKPWLDSGTRNIYADGHFVRSEQFLSGKGRRPFRWDELPEDVLSVGVEVLDDCRDPAAAMPRRTEAGRPPPQTP